MKRIIIPILLAAMAFAGCNATGGEGGQSISPSGVMDTTSTEINKKYTAIDASSCIDVVMSDSVKTLTVVADKAMMQQLDIRVKGNTLNLGLKSKTHLTGNFVIKAFVPYDARIKEVSLSGICSFTSQHPLVGNSFNLKLSGASEATCYFDMPDGRLEATISGNSTLHATGHVKFLEADVSGASLVSSKEELGQYTFTADDAELLVSGSSNAMLHSNGTLRGEVSGASNLAYTGKPKLKIEASGISSIKGI